MAGQTVKGNIVGYVELVLIIGIPISVRRAHTLGTENTKKKNPNDNKDALSFRTTFWVRCTSKQSFEAVAYFHIVFPRQQRFIGLQERESWTLNKEAEE